MEDLFDAACTANSFLRRSGNHEGFEDLVPTSAEDILSLSSEEFHDPKFVQS